ncbi:hypothetical protein MOUN0_O01354 [Monosporozyma unispora]|nr:hypothetical protein C6P44_001947 [Kazachstania unispora]
MLELLLNILALFQLIYYTKADDVFSYSGCYQASSLQSMGLSSMGQYTWQSPSYCQQQCPGSAFVALTQGGDCYCGSNVNVLSASKQSDSNCNKGCNGWPQDMCGDDTGKYMNIYINNAKVNMDATGSSAITGGSSHVHSSEKSKLPSTFISTSTLHPNSNSKRVSSAQTTTISTTQASSSGNMKSTITTSTTSTSSKHESVSSIKFTTRIVTRSVVTTSNKAQQTIVMTATSVIKTVVPTASMGAYYNGTMNLNDKSTTSSSSSLSGGAIAGIVVGCVVGAIAIVALIIFYFLYSKHQRQNPAVDIEESKQYQPYSFGDQDANPVIIPEPTGYLNHGSIKNKLHPHSNANTIIPSNNNSNSTWKLPSRSSTRNNSNVNINNPEPTKRNGSIHSTPTLTNRSPSLGVNDIESNNSLGNTQTFKNPASLNQHVMRRSQLPSTVFEEPTNISFYDGVQRFSTSSLPDMMEQRKPLRIVNPDDSSVRIYDNVNTATSMNSDDIKENSHITEEEEGNTTTSSDDNEKY